MGRIRTLIVDDSVVVRRLIQDVLEADSEVTVIGAAVNGKVGFEEAKKLRPDIITMDIEMPQMNGIEAVKAIRAAGIRCPIIMFSTLTAAGANATMDALAAGASDFVTKPGNVGTIVESMAKVREELIPKIKALTGHGGGRPQVSEAARPGRPHKPLSVPSAATKPDTTPAKPAVPQQKRAKVASVPRILAIGSSTGGPQALSTVLKDLPRDLNIPVVITQHMPPVFTTQLAERLNRDCSLTVVEAKQGMALTPGTIYIAPGDYHMIVRSENRRNTIHLNQDPPENFCRPAVDVMFRSVAQVFGSTTLAVVLTGMGSDGAKGAQVIQEVGGYVVAQDEASSVVWGMPGAVVKVDAHDKVTDLKSIASHLRDRFNKAGRKNAEEAGTTRPSGAF